MLSTGSEQQGQNIRVRTVFPDPDLNLGFSRIFFIRYARTMFLTLSGQKMMLLVKYASKIIKIHVKFSYLKKYICPLLAIDFEELDKTEFEAQM